MGHRFSEGHGTEGCKGDTDEYQTGTRGYPNVKLRPADFETLQMVAADYGVATSTMARMLLRRGIRAAAPNPR
jgi:hypothetical protein